MHHVRQQDQLPRAHCSSCHNILLLSMPKGVSFHFTGTVKPHACFP